MIKSLITEVAQLREQLAQATTTATEYRNRKVEPTTPTIFQLEPTTEEIWDFVKCVIASHPNLPLPTTNLPIKSISNNLQFTRKLDRLIHHSEKNRRDEEIFDQENLEIIIGRVRSWGLMM